MKIILFGYMNDTRSTRKISKACKTDLRYMYLLGNEKAPSHTTIQGVINNLTMNIEDLYIDIIQQINELEEDKIDFNEIFVDGTKIEADANKYTFVWRGSINYHLVNLVKKINKTIKKVRLFKVDIKDFPKMKHLDNAQEIVKKNRERKDKGLEKLNRKAYVEIEENHIEYLESLELALLLKLQEENIELVRVEENVKVNFKSCMRKEKNLKRN